MIPHLKYIETLICLKYSPEKIKEELEHRGLPFDQDIVMIMYKTLKESNPDYFQKQIPADMDWLKLVDIAELFAYLAQIDLGYPVFGVQGAFGILDDPLMYRLVSSLALTKLEDEDIELLVSSRQNFQFTAEDIKMFLKYFFNVQGWSLKDRKEFVDSVDDEGLGRYYRIALKGDKEYLIWKLGLNPDKPQAHILSDLLNDSYFNFKEVSRVNPELAQKWANLALKISEKVDKVNREDKDNPLSEFEFVIKTVNKETSTKPKHISDLD